MFIDSHAHLNFREFEKEIPQTIKRAQEAGVGAIINVGSNYKTSKKTVEIANGISHIAYCKSDYKPYAISNKLYATVGIHPIHLVKDIEEKAVFDGREYSFKTRQESFDYGKFMRLAKSSKKVVAIGETGLDFFRMDEKNNVKFPILRQTQDKFSNFKSNSNDQMSNVKKIQSDVFKQHIKLAEELNLPLIIHGRGTKEDPYGAYDLILKILNSSFIIHNSNPKGVAHCYAGNLKQAKEFVKMGFYIGFTGIVTFKNAAEIQQIAREIPLEKILIETDCPFLAPVPYRGKRNEPAYVVEVAKKIAELKNIALAEVEKQTTKNTKELFGI